MAGQHKMYAIEVLFKSKDKRFKNSVIRGLYAGTTAENAKANTLKLLEDVLNDDAKTIAHTLEIKSLSIIRHEFYFSERALEKQLNLNMNNE